MVSEDIRGQVLSYLQGQAAKLSYSELADRVETALDDLEGLLRPMSDEQARFSAGPDEWSSREVAGHVAMYAPSVSQLIGLLDSGEDGAYYREQGMPPERPSGEHEPLAALAVARDELEGLRRRFADRDPNTEKTFPHPFFGELNAREWTLFLRVHAIDHTNQVKANVAHADYPA
ncbi:MAG: DinB family protein [Dehalococcoidia bacterium]